TSSPETEITIRGAARSDFDDISVVGSRSGRHAGRFVSDPDERAATFLPYQAFDSGEDVAVALRQVGSTHVVRFHFSVVKSAAVHFTAGDPAKPTRPRQVQHFHSAPGLRPPTVTVSVTSSRTAPGYIFLGPANKL